jgi:hypothetical protein
MKIKTVVVGSHISFKNVKDKYLKMALETPIGNYSTFEDYFDLNRDSFLISRKDYISGIISQTLYELDCDDRLGVSEDYLEKIEDLVKIELESLVPKNIDFIEIFI